MSSSDDDEDLKRAIAMSLGETQRPAVPVINLDDTDDEDEDLRRALALSLQDSEKSSIPRPSSDEANTPVTASSNEYASIPTLNAEATTQQQPASTNITTNNSLSGILGLDRKAMEQERLARLGKRKRSVSPERQSKMAAKPSSTPITSEGTHRQVPPKASGIEYPRGTIKRTWAHKHSRTNDITLDEVFQNPKPNIAVLSMFQLDDKWLFSKINPEFETKQISIWNAKEEWRREQILGDIRDCKVPNFKACFPPMDGNISIMHSKLMLLFYETHMRVVIPTANLMKTDWGETNTDARGESWQAGVLENTVFLIDLPRRPEDEVGRKQDLTFFGKELFDFLEAQGVGQRVTEGILKFDFSQTDHIAFVHSIPGRYTDQFANRTAFSGLANAVRKLGLDQIEELEMDYVTSSLGALNEDFLKQMYGAACGGTAPSGVKVLDHIRVYFPTQKTVDDSTGGPACAGIITLDSSHYNSATFPKQCMRDYKSTRAGVLSHNKLLLARGRKKDGTAVAWVYVGSANLTEAAWGHRKTLKSGKPGKMNVRNWESGVLVPVPPEQLAGLALGKGEVPSMDVFKNRLEIPFEYPAEGYDGKHPWFFRQQRGF